MSIPIVANLKVSVYFFVCMVENHLLLESVRELLIVTVGVVFAEGIKYLATKIFIKIDKRIDSPLD